MKLAFAVLLVLHAAIHLLGFAKAFHLAEVRQLPTTIGKKGGLLWLAAALLFGASAVLLFLMPERWWWAAAPALLLSQAAIVSAWSAARFGTIANVVVLVPLALTLIDHRSTSLRSIYRAKAAQVVARSAADGSVVLDSDLAQLPPPVQVYLRRAGVVGRPRVHDVRIAWRGQLKGSETAAFMDAQVEQVETFDGPTRLFYLTASRSGVPFQALHVYEGTSASMRVRVLSLADVVDARGPEMDQSETVTFFNDMWMLAPATIPFADIRWRTIDERRVEATFRNESITITAELGFDAAGDLATFVSHDRYLSADGKTFRRLPWSTPVREYRVVDGYRLPALADAVWSEPDHDFVYARFEIVHIAYNIATGRADRALASVGAR